MEQRLYLKSIEVTLKKDSFCLEVSTNNLLESDYLIGLKEPILADSVTHFHFLIDHPYNESLMYPGEHYSFGMQEMGQLKVYANGSTKAMDDSVFIENYKFMVAHQCHATPYGMMRGWQFNPTRDVYKPCLTQELNALLEIPKGKLAPDQLPSLIGAIDLNNDQLQDLIVLQNHEFYLLLTNGDTKKHYFRTVKKMRFEFGFFYEITF